MIKGTVLYGHEPGCVAAEDIMQLATYLWHKTFLIYDTCGFIYL